MAETKKNVQIENSSGQSEQEKLESVKKADAAVKSMNDFVCIKFDHVRLVQKN